MNDEQAIESNPTAEKRVEAFLEKNKGFKRNNHKLSEEAMECVVYMRAKGFSWKAIHLFLEEEFGVTVFHSSVAKRLLKMKGKKATKLNSNDAAQKPIKTKEPVVVVDTEEEDALPQEEEVESVKTGYVLEDGTVMLNGVRYNRLEPVYFHDDLDLETKLNKLEEDIVSGVVTNLQKVPSFLWDAIVRRYEPSERFRNMIGGKIDFPSLNEAERKNFYTRIAPLHRNHVFLVPIK